MESRVVDSVAVPISHADRAAYRPASREECYSRHREYFDAFAAARDTWRTRNAYYHRELERLLRYYIPEQSRVLEVGCGTGNLLAALKPRRGLGVDLSPKMIEQARVLHPQSELQFMPGSLEDVTPTGEAFDYIVLSDLIGFAYDVLALFRCLKPYCHARTRILINFHSRLWQPILSLAETLGLKYRQPVLNWLTTEDTVNLLQLAGFEVVLTDKRMLVPKYLPVLGRVFNRLSTVFPFRPFCLTNWVMARLPVAPQGGGGSPELSVSVVCPCRNEAGNVPDIVRRLPRLGSHTELILVEGHSKDDTYQACLRVRDEHPEWDISVLQQNGKGKKDAVWLGFSRAKGDVLMILDADLTVPPEDMTAFYEAVSTGRGEFINGSRLVYPMEGQAMRFLNLVGNKFFSMAFSYLIGQNIKDTLCGTKVMLRSDYERLSANRAYFGDFDPFGDFDLLFGAAKLGLRIVDLPVRYRDRRYGQTQISRFRHGWMLLKMCAFALFRMKLR